MCFPPFSPPFRLPGQPAKVLPLMGTFTVTCNIHWDDVLHEETKRVLKFAEIKLLLILNTIFLLEYLQKKSNFKSIPDRFNPYPANVE
jgi:hypothetical protein